MNLKNPKESSNLCISGYGFGLLFFIDHLRTNSKMYLLIFNVIH